MYTLRIVKGAHIRFYPNWDGEDEDVPLGRHEATVLEVNDDNLPPLLTLEVTKPGPKQILENVRIEDLGREWTVTVPYNIRVIGYRYYPSRTKGHHSDEDEEDIKKRRFKKVPIYRDDSSDEDE
jgi:hypothetical protein